MFLSDVAALILWVAFAFVPGEDYPRMAHFSTKQACESAVEDGRERGLLITDCQPVEIKGKPKGSGA